MSSYLVEFLVGGLITVMVVWLANNSMPSLAGIVGAMPLMDVSALLFLASGALVAQTAYANAISHVGVVGAMLMIWFLGGTPFSMIMGLLVWLGISATIFMLPSVAPVSVVSTVLQK